MTPPSSLPNRPAPARISSRAGIVQGAFPGGRPRGAVQASGGAGSFQLPPTMNLSRPGGQRLPAPVQEKMEAFFGSDFSDVRIHVGQEASSIGALAFTHGSNIFFAPGLYNPATPQGQQLLGHELTHVMQQRAGRVRNPYGSGVAVVQDPLMEAEAERMGLRAAMTPLPSAPAQAKMDAAPVRPIAGERPAHLPPALRG
jgi:uncharacterized protein DUF4157